MHIRKYVIYLKGGNAHNDAQSAKEAIQKTRKEFPGVEIIGYEAS